MNQNERSIASNRNDATNYRRYNWTDIERVDSTDLQAKLKNLKPYTQYEILLQAYNQYGRGPVAKIEAFTAGDGKNSLNICHIFLLILMFQFCFCNINLNLLFQFHQRIQRI